MRYGEWIARGALALIFLLNGPELQGRLVNFLKSVAMFGGFCFVAFRTAADAHPRVVMEHRKEEVPR
jgi:hypothetical protein